MTKRGHKISEVKPDSIASELELKPGDVLLAINGQEIEVAVLGNGSPPPPSAVRSIPARSFTTTTQSISPTVRGCIFPPALTS